MSARVAILQEREQRESNALYEQYAPERRAKGCRHATKLRRVQMHGRSGSGVSRLSDAVGHRHDRHNTHPHHLHLFVASTRCYIERGRPSHRHLPSPVLAVRSGIVGRQQKQTAIDAEGKRRISELRRRSPFIVVLRAPGGPLPRLCVKCCCCSRPRTATARGLRPDNKDDTDRNRSTTKKTFFGSVFIRKSVHIGRSPCSSTVSIPLFPLVVGSC